MIVVGVDGSGSSRNAIRFAVDEARLRTPTVKAVYAWQWPRVGFQYIPPDLIDPGGARSSRPGDRRGGGDRSELTRERRDRCRAVEGPSASVLIDASRDADLLVLGSRGRGGFSGLLLGSVGQQCVHQAVCPVVIVRPAGVGTTEGSSS